MLESCMAGLIVAGTHCLVNPHVRWLGCEPLVRPRVYFANHASHLDFVLLWSALPRGLRARTRPVAASDYWDQAKLRRYLIHRVFQGVLVRRGESQEMQDSIDPMLKALDQQESLILFPEGTRGAGDEVGAFRSGIFHIAEARPETELVPAWITNSGRVLPKGGFLPVPLLCSVTFGLPLHIERNEDKAGFLQRLRARLLALEERSNGHLS